MTSFTTPVLNTQDENEEGLAIGPYGGDPYFRIFSPPIRRRIYVNNSPRPEMHVPINYLVYIIISIILAIGILVLLRKI